MNYQTKMKIKRWMRNPFITYGLLAIQIIFFILMTIDGGSTNVNTLLKYGAKYSPWIVRGDWWRLVMPMFLHIGMTHLLLNSVVLYFLGIQLEGVFGPLRYLAIYLLSGLAGNIASFAFSDAISAGASTALFGLFGAAVALGKLYPGNFSMQSMARRFSMLILFNLIFGVFSSSIDLAGHIGGMIGGYTLTYILAPRPQIRRNQAAYIGLYIVFNVLMLAIGFGKYLL